MNGIDRNSVTWNPWHGCHRLSEGCRLCYVYRGDARRGVDSSVVALTGNFDLPLRRNRRGAYRIPAGTTVYTCFTSDFFLPDADRWRPAAWEMIRRRRDLHFFMITKRIDRMAQCLPDDWGEGYAHVTVCCTAENQERADYRLPIYREAPVRHKVIICEPLLSRIDLSAFGIGRWVEQVVAGGESGTGARPCHYEWIEELRETCRTERVDFWFKQTGARFVRDGRTYDIPRRLQHAQARRADINLSFGRMADMACRRTDNGADHDMPLLPGMETVFGDSRDASPQAGLP